MPFTIINYIPAIVGEKDVACLNAALGYLRQDAGAAAIIE
jgi:hypothetical protein